MLYILGHLPSSTKSERKTNASTTIRLSLLPLPPEPRAIAEHAASLVIGNIGNFAEHVVGNLFSQIELHLEESAKIRKLIEDEVTKTLDAYTE